MLTLPALLIGLTFHWTQRHKQWFSWNEAVKAFFIRPAPQRKNAHCQSLQMRNEMHYEKLFVFKSFISQFGLLHQPSFYLCTKQQLHVFNLKKICPSLLSWHLYYIQTTLQFNADKDFPSHMVCLSSRGPLRMNRDNLYYSDFSFCGFCNFPTKLWCLKMTFWKLDLTAWNPMTQNCQQPVCSLEGLVMTACLQLLFKIRINFRWIVIFLRNAIQI